MKHCTTGVFVIIALSTALLGISMALMGHHKHIQLITDFYRVSPLFTGSTFNAIASVSFIISALLSLAALKNIKLRPILGYLLMAISSLPLLSLLASSMWIDSLGGFPAIGSGQGIIKYFALFALGLILAAPKLSINSQKWLTITPVLLVLIWIGGMKFTLLEAKGIEDLVLSSPLMAWMYNVWDLQTTSNIIGLYDLIAVALLIAAMFNNKLVLPAITLSGAVFIVTQTFLLTWPNALSTSTLLSTGGHFLIKDLWFIANLIVFWQLSHHDNIITNNENSPAN